MKIDTRNYVNDFYEMYSYSWRQNNRPEIYSIPVGHNHDWRIVEQLLVDGLKYGKGCVGEDGQNLAVSGRKLALQLRETLTGGVDHGETDAGQGKDDDIAAAPRADVKLGLFALDDGVVGLELRQLGLWQQEVGDRHYFSPHLQ